MLKEMNKNVILSERLVLQALNFDLVVVHPLNYLMIKMRELKGEQILQHLLGDSMSDCEGAVSTASFLFTAYTDEMSKKNLLQTAVNFLNDSYRGTFCLEYTPSEIGAAVLFLATITLSLRPLSPARSHVEVSWIQLLEKDIREYRLRSICLEIMDMYEDLALIMPGLDADGKKEMRQQITAQVITQLGNTFPSHLSLKSMSSQDDSLHDGTTNQTTPALQYGQDDHAFELDTPRETGRKTLDDEEALHGQTGGNHNISYGASEDDTHGGRRPNVTVTKIVNSSSSSVQYQHNQQTMSATASSSTMFTNVVINGALLTPSSISGMERGETSTMSFAAQSEDANSYIEETPVYYNMPLDDGPTDTPTFSDLATKVRPNSRQRSRSNSLSDYASFGMDFKRTRAE